MKDIDIKDIRIEINKIDEKMADLFEKRMDLSKEVAKYKMERALPVFDPKREKEVIDRNLSFITKEEYKPYYVDFLQNTMDVSKNYQRYLTKGLKVAYAGEPGAFAQIACMKIFPEAEIINFPSFAMAYESVQKGETDTCVLPIENSFAGDVGNVMDLIFSGNLYINQIFELEVTHTLVAKKGADINKIKTVISHPQALAQCNEYIENHNFEVIEAVNTAIAARKVSKDSDETIAAIASKETAELYGLEVIDHHLNTSNSNTTRFAVFSKTLNMPDKKVKMGQHFILVFTVVNEAGCLAKTLNIIGSHSFNMRNLRSRPMKGLMWNYYFFVELEGNVNSIDGEQMLKELSTICDRLKLVGTYVCKN